MQLDFCTKVNAIDLFCTDIPTVALKTLRDKLRSKEIWVVGAKRYCNPEEDLPQDFEIHREIYYKALGQPLDALTFISQLHIEMTQALTMLDKGMPSNKKVSK